LRREYRRLCTFGRCCRAASLRDVRFISGMFFCLPISYRSSSFSQIYEYSVYDIANDVALSTRECKFRRAEPLLRFVSGVAMRYTFSRSNAARFSLIYAIKTSMNNSSKSCSSQKFVAIFLGSSPAYTTISAIYPSLSSTDMMRSCSFTVSYVLMRL
jgi:hypothetical protein